MIITDLSTIEEIPLGKSKDLSKEKYEHFKAIKNISLLLFHDYFKFIQSYRIPLTICK